MGSAIHKTSPQHD